MSQATDEPVSPFADALDRFVSLISSVLIWANALLIATIITQVIMRYGFGRGLVALEELQWHLYALGCMFGLAYAQSKDSHIRVDILHMALPTRAKKIFEIIGIFVFLFPFIWVVFDSSLDFVYDSWRIDERSDAPSGLPMRWAIKAVIPLSFGLLFIATLSRLVRDVTWLRRN